ncbi:Ran binding domain [Dillenia turbinata]|uniref:Ran binding domain n=1 Tax=Dillenia turbinata TaxID=194707 RepID=A0AAN8UQR6_9MAGN
MGDTENAPPSKKRVAGRQLSRDNPEPEDNEDASEQETGTFKRASDEVLASRRIVKIRRQPTTAPSSNPFAGIRLAPPSEPSAATTTTAAEAQASNETVAEDTSGKNEVTNETEEGKDENDKQSECKAEEPVKQDEEGSEPGKQDEAGNESVKQDVPADESSGGKEKREVASEETEVKASDADAAGAEKADKQDQKENGTNNKDSGSDAAPLSSFQQLSTSKNAFTGLAGTGFSSSTFSFGSLSKEGSALGAGSSSLFGLKSDQPFGFGLSNNGSSSIFGAAAASIGSKEGSSFQSLQEVPVETGEENEKTVFMADSILFEFIDGGWKERGKGELKLNISTTGAERARLVMRARGNLRLILNANLYPDMKLTNMDKKGITFACMNGTGEGKEGLSTFALKFKDSSIVEEFRGAVMAHKGKAAPSLKTPENSPKASED